jgi:sterol desaturase/sphingolipid hydroxylase (fatty acid hydroxylase superfamily)
MTNSIKSISTVTLLLLIVVVTLFSENTAQAWFPQKDELRNISFKSALIIDLITLIILVDIAYFIVHLIN